MFCQPPDSGPYQMEQQKPALLSHPSKNPHKPFSILSSACKKLPQKHILGCFFVAALFLPTAFPLWLFACHLLGFIPLLTALQSLKPIMSLGFAVQIVLSITVVGSGVNEWLFWL